MKNLKKLMLLAILAFCVMALTAAKPASAATHRNIYGYVFGPGINKGDVSSITLYDDTAPSSSDLWNNLGYDSWSGGLR